MAVLACAQGKALNEEVNEAKLHQSRLAELEAEVVRLTGLHSDTDCTHKDHLARLDPLRNRHRSLQVRALHCWFTATETEAVARHTSHVSHAIQTLGLHGSLC